MGFPPPFHSELVSFPKSFLDVCISYTLFQSYAEPDTGLLDTDFKLSGYRLQVIWNRGVRACVRVCVCVCTQNGKEGGLALFPFVQIGKFVQSLVGGLFKKPSSSGDGKNTG
jgi:hypothetical protein